MEETIEQFLARGSKIKRCNTIRTYSIDSACDETYLINLIIKNGRLAERSK